MARLFVAARPPPSVRDTLAHLDRPDGQGVRWVPDGVWHVTLRFLGEADPTATVDALRSLAAPVAVAVLGPTVERLGERVVCVPVAGLDDLAEAVHEATRGVVPSSAARPFRGHLTLGRLRREEVEVALLGAPVSARFVVDTVALVESRIGSGPARHRVLAEQLLVRAEGEPAR